VRTGPADGTSLVRTALLRCAPSMPECIVEDRFVWAPERSTWAGITLRCHSPIQLVENSRRLGPKGAVLCMTRGPHTMRGNLAMECAALARDSEPAGDAAWTDRPSMPSPISGNSCAPEGKQRHLRIGSDEPGHPSGSQDLRHSGAEMELDFRRRALATVACSSPAGPRVRAQPTRGRRFYSVSDISE
jgi:hypothetical protein